MSGSPDEAADFRGHDYFDFGCSSGGQLVSNRRLFPDARGMGIDIDAAKIAAARANGHNAIAYDILCLPKEKLVRYVTLSHFLEHLSSVAEARQMVSKAIAVAREFVLIRQPWFDSDGDLLELGSKFYWSHWSGHRNKMSSLDFYTILQDELLADRVRRFVILGRGRVAHTDHPAVHPLHAPHNQHAYDPALHGEKPPRGTLHRAFREIVVSVELVEGAGGLQTMLADLGSMSVLFDSAARNPL